MKKPSRIPWVITKDRFLTQSEVNRLYEDLAKERAIAMSKGLKASVIRDYFLIRLLFETGLRVSEAASLRVSDYRDGSLIVRRGKGGRPRTVLLTEETQTLLDEYLSIKASYLNEPVGTEDFILLSERKRQYTTRGIRMRVKHWYSRSQVPSNLSCHSARHTYISFMIAAGVDLPIIRDNAGHSSLAVTSIYSHAVKDSLGSIRLYTSEFTTKGNSYKKSFPIETSSRKPSPAKVDHEDNSFHIENAMVRIRN